MPGLLLPRIITGAMLMLVLVSGGAHSQAKSGPSSSPFETATPDEQQRQQAEEDAKINRLNGVGALASFSRSEKSKLIRQFDGLTNEERLALLNQNKQFQRQPEASKAEVIAVLAQVVPPPPPVNQPPIASFTFAPSVRQPNRIEFDAQASRDPDGGIASYVFRFSDGGSVDADAQRASYEFPFVPGTSQTYWAELTVTDNLGATATQRQEITIDARDTTAPVVTRVTGYRHDGGYLFIEVYGQLSDVVQAEVSINGGAWTPATPNAAGATYRSYMAAEEGFIQGSNEIRVRVIDWVGNISNAGAFYVNQEY